MNKFVLRDFGFRPKTDNKTWLIKIKFSTTITQTCSLDFYLSIRLITKINKTKPNLFLRFLVADS